MDYGSEQIGYNPELEYMKEQTLNSTEYLVLAKRIVNSEEQDNQSLTKEEQQARTEAASLFFRRAIPELHNSSIGFSMNIISNENGRENTYRFPFPDTETPQNTNTPQDDIPTLIIENPQRFTQKLTELLKAADAPEKFFLPWTNITYPQTIDEIKEKIRSRWNTELLDTNPELFLEQLTEGIHDSVFNSLIQDIIEKKQTEPNEKVLDEWETAELYASTRKAASILERIWRNATPYDFQHPEEYIEKVTAFINDSTFETLSTEIHDLGKIPTFEEYSQLQLTRKQAASGFETPYVLAAYLADPETKDSIELPYVRYAIAEKTAYIYAVQKRYISEAEADEIAGNPTAEELRANREEQKHTIPEIFRKSSIQYPEEFTAVFGEIPQDILALENPEEFIKQYRKYLKETKPFLFERGTLIYYLNESEKTNKLKQSGLFKAFTDMDDYNVTHKQYQNLVKKEKRIKKANRKFFKVNEGVPESEELREYKQTKKTRESIQSADEIDEETYPEANINEVQPSALLATTIALRKLQEEGIRDIIVPLYLPIRWEDHLNKTLPNPEGTRPKYTEQDIERIHFTTTNNFLRLFRRLTQQIEGITIIALPDESPDGNLHIKLSEAQLTSTNTLLSQTIEAASQQ